MIDVILNINSALVLLFCALSAYQYLYILVSILFPARRFTAENDKRFAVLICARNEETVIAQLIDSIHKQTYPADLIDIFVLADNCTDRTEEIAQACGAHTYVRQNTQKIGKGYALDFLFRALREEYGDTYYDGYFVFDADNLLAPDYIEQMNTVFSNGFRVVTGYRNSKNLGKNWVTAGYGIMFLREARHMNNARMILHTCSNISGTGFLVHRDIINEIDGWPYHTLTEDLEFTMDRVAEGERIGYCHDAVFYDEQPTTFVQSWHQRIRWSKGFMQAALKRGGKVLRGMFRPQSAFPCFDEVMSTLPTLLLSVFATVSIISMVGAVFTGQVGFLHFLAAFGAYLLGIYGVNYFLGLLTVITEWKKMHCPAWKKIFYTFTFPIFMITNIPITIASLFCRSRWKQIVHSDSKTIAELQNEES